MGQIKYSRFVFSLEPIQMYDSLLALEVVLMFRQILVLWQMHSFLIALVYMASDLCGGMLT